MHTEIKFHGDPQTYRERRVIPDRGQQHAREIRRQMMRLHLEYIRRKRAILDRLKVS